MDIIILVSLLIFTLFITGGVPIAFSFLSATIFLVIVKDYDPSFLMSVGFSSLNSVTLLTLPFFIATGYLVTGGSIANRLIDFVNTMVGSMRGGLGVVAVLVSCIFGAISGAAASSVIAIGTVMIPKMEEHGYPRGYSAALISSSAVLSTMIPPSLAMILYAFVTNQSVAACFLATIGPALFLAAAFSIANVVMVRKMPSVKTDPELDLKIKVQNFKKKGRLALGALFLPIMILGGIYGGIMTPTEAAAAAVFYTLIMSMAVYREMSFGKAALLLRSSVATTGTLMIMMFFAAILARIFTMEQVPQQIATSLLSLSSEPIIILLLINLFLILVGMVIDELSAILLVTPLLFPITLELGIHPVHFAAIVGTNLGLGMMTPPMAGILFIGARTAGVTIDKMMKPTFVLIIFCSIPAILLTTFVPDLSLFLPKLAGFIK